MGWKIIEIEQGQNIYLFINNLVIINNDEKITIPIKDIDVLMLNNYKLKITIQLINELSNNNILTIICNNNYLPSSIIIPIIGHHNTLKIIQSQINWNHKWKSFVWEAIIKNKIYNQARLIEFLKLDNNIYIKLDSMINEIKSYDASNREGHASKIYWHTLIDKNFKRHNDDYINKLLNYGYTILRAYITRSIIKKGLDPRISIFHKSFHNFFALSSDLMEPFRIIIDYEVYKIYITGEVHFYNHKEVLIKKFADKILINETPEFINNAIDKFIDSIVKQGDIPKIRLIYDER